MSTASVAVNRPIDHQQPAISRLILPMALLISIVATQGFATTPALAETAERQSVIEVSGTGSADVKPDMAILTLGVDEQAKTARAALDASSKKLGMVLEAMKARGIEPRDLQTSNFSVSPLFEHYPAEEGKPQKPPKVVGYAVSNQLSLRIRKLEILGQVLDEAVTLGANNGGNLQFTNAEPEKAMQEARQLAMKEAIAKATTLTTAAGVKLGKVLRISETGMRPRPEPMAMAGYAKAMSADAEVPIATGENTYSVTVSVEWEISQ